MRPANSHFHHTTHARSTYHPYPTSPETVTPEQDDKISCSVIATFVTIVASLALGALLMFVEFGMAFYTSPRDQILHALVVFPLWILNPIGMIGWALYAKRAIGPDAALLVFVSGACLSAIGWGYMMGLRSRE